MQYVAPLDEIRFLLRHIAPIERLAALPRYAHADPELVDNVLAEAAKIAAEIASPLRASGDEEGAHLRNGVVVMPAGFREAYAQLRDGGWLGLSMPRDWGGQGMPQVVQTAFCEMMSGANMAFGMSAITPIGAAKVIDTHGTPEQKQTWMPGLADGTSMATIVMTEPHAGSDIGLARVRAVKRGDGRYAISGTKIFISFADHDLTDQIVHIVLARTPDAPPGTKGLSLFLVPKRLVDADGKLGAANNVRVARLEKKMGLKASPTCEVLFENAMGELIGKEGEGIRNMFVMMNSMRLDVGAQSVGVASAAVHKALAYVQERRQGGRGPDGGPVLLIEHPDVRRQVLSMRAWCDGMRALLYTGAFHEDLVVGGAGGNGSETARADSRDLVEWLLPLIKAGASDASNRIANQAVQLHGGHGYVADHGVEQLVRDGRINAIYEGANAIQGIDLVTRKLGSDGGRRQRVFLKFIRADLAAHRGNPATREISAALEEALPIFEDASRYMTEALAKSSRDALAGASPYLDLVATVATGWMWLRMAAHADPANPAEAIKPVLARFFAEHALSGCDAFARQAKAGAATLDLPSAEQLRAW
jgi:alkylation response protein AidB-like acyl-CoA dehydrogenase